MIKVAVVMPTLKNKEGGFEALQSIRGALNIWWMPIIIDNWRTPRSVPESWNYGIEQAKLIPADYVLVLNDDVLFSPWTLTGLVKAFETPMKPSNTMMVTGINMRDKMEPEDIFNIEIPSHQTHDFDFAPDFSCFMITPEAFTKIGSFDENFKPAYFEDNDYHRRIKLMGGEAICSSWAPFYHYGSKTQNFDPNNPTVKPEEYVKNQWYYIEKWGGMGPGTEIYDHPYNDPQCAASRWKYCK